MVLLLAGAAVVPAGGARAADLSGQLPAPPRLATCGGADSGFRLPGTDGCLRIGGFVAAEAGWSVASPGLALADRTTGAGGGIGPGSAGDLSRPSLGVGTRVSADLRLPTEVGPVRVFVSVRGRKGLATDGAHP